MGQLPTVYPDTEYLEDAEMVSEEEPRGNFLTVMWVLLFLVALGGAWIYGYDLGFNSPKPQIQPVESSNGKVFPIEFGRSMFVVPEPYLRRIERNPDSTVKRVELALFWPRPSLSFLGSGDQPATGTATLRDGLLISLEARGTSVGPAKRLNDIFVHYFAGERGEGPGGLQRQPLKRGTVYDGQELLIGKSAYYLCFAEDSALTPAMCRGERLALEEFKVTYRFHRAHLGNWRAIEARITQLITEVASARN